MGAIDDDAVAFIDVDGVRTRYAAIGEGPPLVLVHGGHFGATMSLATWSRNLDALAEDFTVYAPDKIGQGHTDNPSRVEDYVFETTITHLDGFLSALGLQDMHLVGHSRGALTAAAVAVDSPDRVRSLTIVDSNTMAPVPAAAGHEFYASLDDPPGPPTKDSVRIEPEANSFSTEHLTDDFLETRLELARLEKTARANERLEAEKKDRFLPSVDRVTDRVLAAIDDGELSCPTLTVWGRNDPSATLDLGVDLYTRIAEGTEAAEFHVLNRAGHYSFREQPAAFNRVVRAFCAAASTAT